MWCVWEGGGGRGTTQLARRGGGRGRGKASRWGRGRDREQAGGEGVRPRHRAAGKWQGAVSASRAKRLSWQRKTVYCGDAMYRFGDIAATQHGLLR